MNHTQPMSTGGQMGAAPAVKDRRLKRTPILPRILRAVLSSNKTAANVRRALVWGIFWIVFLLRMWRSNPGGWIDHTRAIFIAFFSANFVGGVAAALNMVWFAITRLFSPVVLVPVLILLAPFLLAWQIAAIYLQDIFELEHVWVARRYLMQATLAEEYAKINTRAGTIDPKNIDSPLIQIGGPGKIQVELDSAALFEKADGTCRVVGPTVDAKDSFIEGFERLREVIDLRDLATDALTITCRSRDGIPVIAKDVRLVASVNRGKQTATLEKPFPFEEDAIRQLVFQQTNAVTPGQPRTLSLEDYWKQTHKRWSGTMPGLISGALGDFVSEHNLSEFLANIGKVELESLARLEAEIRAASSTIAPVEGETTGPEESPEQPKFTPRSKLTSLFYDFTSVFPKRAENRGVQLGWVGVGTWSTPASAELISKNHLEAWKISRENYLRGHEEVLEQLREDARLQELQNLVHKTLLANFKAARDQDLLPEEVVHKLLVAYREQFIAAWELYERDRKADSQAVEPPEKLAEALRILNGFLSHRIS